MEESSFGASTELVRDLHVVQVKEDDDFNGYGFFGWLNKWRSRDATTSSLQGEGVNRTQGTLQRETVGYPQKRENTNDREEEEARRVPSQVKTTKLKSKIFIIHVHSVACVMIPEEFLCLLLNGC